jgi:hypothetical protein
VRSPAARPAWRARTYPCSCSHRTESCGFGALHAVFSGGAQAGCRAGGVPPGCGSRGAQPWPSATVLRASGPRCGRRAAADCSPRRAREAGGRACSGLADQQGCFSSLMLLDMRFLGTEVACTSVCSGFPPAVVAGDRAARPASLFRSRCCFPSSFPR